MHKDKSKVKISQKFVAFSEYMSVKYEPSSLLRSSFQMFNVVWNVIWYETENLSFPKDMHVQILVLIKLFYLPASSTS